MNAALLEVRNPASRLAAIRDPMTIVADMLRWDAAEVLLESARCLNVRSAADRAWCIETMMHLMRTGLRFEFIWTRYALDPSFLVMQCVIDGVMPTSIPDRHYQGVSVIATTRPEWFVQDGPVVSYMTRDEWLAAIAKYKLQ